MALCHNCDEARIEYIGNGSQTDYTFPFEYNEREDVAVANWNAEFLVWEPVTTGWGFLNDTTLRFDEAPENEQKFIIYRCTDLEPLPAEFYPGTPIKAKDLNDNFFVLKNAIEEARCAIGRQDEKAEEKYWNKVPYTELTQTPTPDTGETVFSYDPWVDTDDAVASTAAIGSRIEEEIAKNIVTSADVRAGLWTKDSELDNDEQVPSTAATSERLDPFFQENLPEGPSTWRIPGKLWFDNDEVITRVWDQENGTWVASGLSGPPGPIGPKGTYATIVSETAPTRRLDNSPLVSGDIWFRSTTAELFVWYDDGQPDGVRGRQWVQAVGGAGSQGPPGPPSFPDAPADGITYGRKDNDWEPVGSSKLTFTAPLVESNGNVSINLQILNPA